MKNTDIDKLYQQLSSPEKASLAFNALLLNDGTTAKKITNTVPMKSYSQRDDDYVEKVRGFFDVLSALSAEYWQKQYFVSLSAGTILIEVNRKNNVLADQAMDQHALFLGQLIALQHVVDQTAKTYHIDRNQLCDKIGFDSEETITPLDELPEEAQLYFSALVDLVNTRMTGTQTSEETQEFLRLN